jgi:hypothetical protein
MYTSVSEEAAAFAFRVEQEGSCFL